MNNKRVIKLVRILESVKVESFFMQKVLRRGSKIGGQKWVCGDDVSVFFYLVISLRLSYSLQKEIIIIYM